MIVNYTRKSESDIDKFTSNGSRIELKEYMNDLLFYTPLDNLRADFALYDYVSKYSTKPLIYTGGKFGSYIKINDTLKFDGNNIQPLGEEGRISFYIGTNKSNDNSTIIFSDDNFPESGLPAGEYSINIAVQDYPTATVAFEVDEGCTFAQLKNKFLFNLDPKIYRFELDVDSNTEHELYLKSTVSGKTIKALDGSQGTSLLNYLTIKDIDYGTYPSEEITVFEIGNLSVIHYGKKIDNKTYSYLKIKIMEQEIEFPWNNDGISLDNLEIDFDKQVVYIFLNGELKKIELLDAPRTSSNSDLILRGLTDEYYSFDELIINNRVIHRESFELPTTQLTKYTTEKPYIDFYFSSDEVKTGMKLMVNDQYNTHAIINDNGKFYFFNAMSWRQSDGSFSKSNDFYTFQNQLEQFDFSGSDFFIRIFFESNGNENSYIDGIMFDMDDELYQDEEGNISAILIGDKEWECESSSEEPEKVDLIDTQLNILTDQGTTVIPFTKEAYYEYKYGDSSYDSSSEEYSLFLDIDEVIDYINYYYPVGIRRIYKDSKDRVCLISETKGSNAYITLTGDAAPLIFGETLSAEGKDATYGNIDYSKFYSTVKTYTGDPLLGIEATDEQIQLYLKEALEYYKRYKGDELNQYACQLEGNFTDGFKIPSIIEQQSDIVDIIFKPVFPLKFYGEELIDGNDDIVTLTLANYLFGGSYGTTINGGIAQDWYVSLMSLETFKQTLGLNPSWEILNNRIHIYPAHVFRYTTVSIIYKAPISLEKALNDPDIMKYVSGKILQLAGTTRGSYGSRLNAGSMELQFNADAMYDRGSRLIEEVMNRWQSMQPPLGFFLY